MPRDDGNDRGERSFESLRQQTRGRGAYFGNPLDEVRSSVTEDAPPTNSDRFFIYIGSASFVFINHYALSPTLFSLCFALNAATFFAFSQMTARLTARFGLAPVIRVAVSGFAGVTAILAVLMTLGADSLPLMMGFLFVGYGCLENARVLRRMSGFARTLLQTSIAFWRRSVGA